MAKKKNNSKKHKFKHVETAAGEATVVASATEATGEVRTAPAKPAQVARAGAGGGLAAPARDFGYVGADVRRIAMMAVGLIAIEVVLYVVLGGKG